MAGFDPELDLPTEDDVVEAELRMLGNELFNLLAYPGSTYKAMSDHFHQYPHGNYRW
jgi:hypothetical protein